MLNWVKCLGKLHYNDISWRSAFHRCRDFLHEFKQLRLTGSVLAKAVLLGAQNVAGLQVIHDSTNKHVFEDLTRDTREDIRL